MISSCITTIKTDLTILRDTCKTAYQTHNIQFTARIAKAAARCFACLVICVGIILTAGVSLSRLTKASVVSLNKKIALPLALIGLISQVNKLFAVNSVPKEPAKPNFDHWYSANANTAPVIESDNIFYDDIPEEHEKDPVLSQFICSITGKSIRYPVTIKNPQGDHLADIHLERHGVVAMFDNHFRAFPFPPDIHIEEFRENLEIRKIIEDRMTVLQIPK